ncbi:MAG: thymidine phosphorylase [Acidobacteriota bacterium]|nr:thymidine phosphorylase [Acidobacteriota bacterium]MDE3222945.1 thymidine phosphorylase [Acidobacteriota bacterium]
MSYSTPLLIAAKRDGQELSDAAITWLLEAYGRGDVADEQMSAMLMAIFFRGLGSRELGTWTKTMINSGERLDLRGLSRPTVDKHSTGGVGDKISLILAPLVAACGAAVPQLSGRGLGHTGGTLDKLESIPGWRAALTNDEVYQQLENVGAVICAAGSGLAPVDRRLYALRDVTATVESIPLIASSIMSKKIAEGTDALVLDVKVGRGAFLKDRESSLRLARTMVDLGTSHGVHTVAQLTNMDEPLGRSVGNALEVEESVEVLRGGGPRDVRDLTVALASIMLELVGLDDNPAARLDDGSAYDVYRAMISAQGGDPDAPLARSAHRETIVAPRAGVVQSIDAYRVGVAAWRQGAGRARKEDPVSAGAGVEVLVRRGDRVEKGQPLFVLHADDEARLRAGHDEIVGALMIGDEPVVETPLLFERVDATS